MDSFSVSTGRLRLAREFALATIRHFRWLSPVHVSNLPVDGLGWIDARIGECRAYLLADRVHEIVPGRDAKAFLNAVARVGAMSPGLHHAVRSRRKFGGALVSVYAVDLWHLAEICDEDVAAHLRENLGT